MKALKIKFECPSCGNILTDFYPAKDINMLKRNLVSTHLKCSCGRTGRFRILEFATAEYELKDSDDKIIDEKEEQNDED